MDHKAKTSLERLNLVITSIFRPSDGMLV